MLFITCTYLHVCMYVSAQKRKHAAANASVAMNGPSPFHVSSVPAAATQKATAAVDKDEGSSDEELFDADAQWYWRDDKRYMHVHCVHMLGYTYSGPLYTCTCTCIVDTTGPTKSVLISEKRPHFRDSLYTFQASGDNYHPTCFK